MLDGIGKGIKYIVTDDIRYYLTEYQTKKKIPVKLQIRINIKNEITFQFFFLAF